MLAGFAAPPVLAALGAPPVRVLQRAADAGRLGALGWIAALAALATLLFATAHDPKLALWIGLGSAGAALALAAVAALLVALIARYSRGLGVSWRFGIGNLARRRLATVAQLVALGVAALALLLLVIVRAEVLGAWQARIPADAPNQFLINVLPGQREPLARFFQEQGLAAPELVPMTRARLTALNERPVTADSFEDPETRRWINREFNLSWTARFGDDSHFLEGAPWGEEANGQRWLVVDQYAREHLKLKLGDRLTLDFAGQPLSFTVKAVRDIRWDSFRPNFFLVVPPGVLDAPAFAGPLQYITSFHLPEERRAVLRGLLREFPNVTALDLGAALAQARRTIDRVVAALQFVFAFAAAAGLVVMLAVIEGSKAERVREIGVLRALGATRATILRGLAVEYAVLGGIAGGIAAVAAQALAWVLAARVFDLPVAITPWVGVAGALGGAVVVAGAGLLALRRIIATPPRVVLASA
jgi:putative ABC transport system permease protein